MSAQAIETILSRAMSDATFAESLFTDSEKAVAGYDLTAEELAGVKKMSRTEFGKFAAAAPEERKSMMNIPLPGGTKINHNQTILTVC
jgi:hypothetical protein